MKKILTLVAVISVLMLAVASFHYYKQEWFKVSVSGGYSVMMPGKPETEFVSGDEEADGSPSVELYRYVIPADVNGGSVKHAGKYELEIESYSENQDFISAAPAQGINAFERLMVATDSAELINKKELSGANYKGYELFVKWKRHDTYCRLRFIDVESDRKSLKLRACSEGGDSYEVGEGANKFFDSLRLR